MVSEVYITHGSFLLSDFLSATIIFIGTLFLMRSLKVFGGERFRQPASMIGAGTLLFAFAHEWGEFMCGSGIHGGVPETLFGKIHIIFLGVIGSTIFLVGCFLLYRRYAEYLNK